MNWSFTCLVISLLLLTENLVAVESSRKSSKSDKFRKGVKSVKDAITKNVFYASKYNMGKPDELSATATGKIAQHADNNESNRILSERFGSATKLQDELENLGTADGDRLVKLIQNNTEEKFEAAMARTKAKTAYLDNLSVEQVRSRLVYELIIANETKLEDLPFDIISLLYSTGKLSKRAEKFRDRLIALSFTTINGLLLKLMKSNDIEFEQNFDFILCQKTLFPNLSEIIAEGGNIDYEALRHAIENFAMEQNYSKPFIKYVSKMLKKPLAEAQAFFKDTFTVKNLNFDQDKHALEKVDQILCARPNIVSELLSLAQLDENYWVLHGLTSSDFPLLQCADLSSVKSCFSRILDATPENFDQLTSYLTRELSSSDEIGGVCRRTDFSIVKELGRGVFGTVSRAQHFSGKEFALKKIHYTNIHGNEEAIGREIAIQAHLDHPNIVKLYCAMRGTKQRGSVYLVTEFCPGGDLVDTIEDGNSYTIDRLAQIAADLLQGIHYMHDQGYAHLDIKPANALVCEHDRVKLIDFGESQKEDLSKDKYVIHGTDEFIAPEVWARTPFGRSADYWALGVLLYYLHTRGSYPYDTSDKWKDYASYLTETWSLDENLPQDFDPELAQVIRVLMIKDPQERFTQAYHNFESLKKLPFFKNIDWDS